MRNEFVELACSNCVGVYEGQRESRVPDNHRASRSTHDLDRTTRQPFQRATDLDVDHMAAFTYAFNEKFGRSRLLGRKLVDIIGRAR